MDIFSVSKNKEKLIQAKGKILPFQFTALLFEHTEVIQTESEVSHVLTDFLDGEGQVLACPYFWLPFFIISIIYVH